MAILFAERLEILLGTLLLASPLLIGVALVVWTHRLSQRGRIAYAPTLLATAAAVVGVVTASTASSGLQGLGEVLIGLYLVAAGGLTALICGVVTYGRARTRPKGAAPEVDDVRRQR